MKRLNAFSMAVCAAGIVCTTSRPAHAQEPLKEGPTVSAEEALGPPAPAPPPFAYNRQAIGDISGYIAKQAAADAQERLGQSRLKQGNLNGAVEALRAAVDLRPLPETYEMLIDALLLARRDAEALATFREYVYPKPGRKINSSGNQNPDTLLHFALLLAKMGQYEEAIAAYHEGEAKVSNLYGGPRVDLAFFPKAFNKVLFDAAVHTCLGLEARMFRTDPEGVKANAVALAEYRKAIAAKPDFALAYFYLGETLRVVNGGLSDEARAAYEKAVKLGRGAVVERAQKALDRP